MTFNLMFNLTGFYSLMFPSVFSNVSPVFQTESVTSVWTGTRKI